MPGEVAGLPARTLDLVFMAYALHDSAEPQAAVDSIPIAAQIILGLQTIVSRRLDLTAAPAILTTGTIAAGAQGGRWTDAPRLFPTAGLGLESVSRHRP